MSELLRLISAWKNNKLIAMFQPSDPLKKDVNMVRFLSISEKRGMMDKLFGKKPKSYHVLCLGFWNGQTGIWLALKDEGDHNSKELMPYYMSIKHNTPQGVHGLYFCQIHPSELLKFYKQGKSPKLGEFIPMRQERAHKEW